MGLPIRLALVLGCGAALFLWFRPPEGIGGLLLILGYIIVAAYVDAWWGQRGRGRARAAAGSHKVVSLKAYRNHVFRRRGPYRHKKYRPASRLVFQAGEPGAAHEVSQALLADGLSPRIIQRHDGGSGHTARYEVRLPEDQVERAQHVIDRFQYRAAQFPQ
jgi:uncharacterized protein YndB with AHSA1/START domain